MKKILFLIICLYISFNVNAQWRRRYVQGDDFSEWSYVYDIGDKSITFTESGLLMIAAKNRQFLTDKTGNTLVVIVVTWNGKLVTKGQFSLPVTPDGHATGANGFRALLDMVRKGCIIRVVAPLINDFDFDLTTTKMYEGQIDDSKEVVP